jgi:cell division septation protein DedD
LDSLVKERLTGAIILVVLIVLLVPELLSGPSRSAPAPQAADTSSVEPPLRSYTINLADDSHGASATAGTSDASPQASGPAQPTPIVESRTADSPTAAQATTPDADSPSTSSGNAGNPATAPAAVQNSPSASNPSGDSWQEQPKAGGPHGPAPQQQRSAAPDRATPDRTAAQRYAATERPPTERPPTTDRAEAADKSSTGGWMVQLGVFSIQANAERLAQELKSQGFRALVSENGGGGRPLWRVRAGPVAERAAAEQLSAKLRAAGHAGSIVPK